MAEIADNIGQMRPPASYAPAPDLATWLRALRGSRVDDNRIAAPWLQADDRFTWVSRTAHSLRLIAIARRKWTLRNPEPIIWLPEYICDSALQPLRTSGVKLRLYPVVESMVPDYKRCREMASEESPDIFVLVHYFGRGIPTGDSAEFCRTQKCWLVEDAAHIFMPMRGVGEKGDFVLYSPHKHLPLPDRALLITRPTAGIAVNATPAEVADEIVARTKDGARVTGGGIWLAKRVLQRMGFRRLRRPTKGFLGDVASPCSVAVLPSLFSGRLLSAMLPNLLLYRFQRFRNGCIMSHVTGAAEKACGPAAPVYLVTVECSTPEYASKRYSAYQQLGWPVCSWPDLPPELLEDVNYNVARRRRQHDLHFHVHQDLDLAAIALADRRVTRAPYEDVHVTWHTGSLQLWNELYARAIRPHLLQSGIYQRAKQAEKSRKEQYGILWTGKDPIAIFVATRVTWGVWRINRGPLFLEKPTDNTVRSVLRCLRRAFRGRVLSIAPNLVASASNWLALAGEGYRARSVRPTTTAWLDLRQGETTLRAKLASKWRNALSYAERAGLVSEVSESADTCEWLWEKQKEAMEAKNFVGVSETMLRALQKQKALTIVRARSNGVLIAAIAVALHSPGATYLIGWNGAEGRSLKANQFLLWNAALWLSARGITDFDLGGIDEEALPGISEFKLGTGGERVQLVGEYISV